MCISEPNCNFISHAQHARSDHTSCALCGACDLSADDRVALRFTSWLRGPSPVMRLESRPAVSDAILQSLLQGEYSKALYGAEDRVEISSLRLIWLSLLDRVALERVASVGICKVASRRSN